MSNNNHIISEIEQYMLPYLDNEQLEHLRKILSSLLIDQKKTTDEADKTSKNESVNNELFIDNFLSAKRVEGCSCKTLKLYNSTLKKAFASIDKTVKKITTEDLRKYLDEYSKNNKAGKVTIDNMRRILSSFFNWLEEENYIIKSPVKRIHKVRTGKTVKATFSDEMLEQMRDCCKTNRDLAIIDLLSSSGMRVGELVHLNRDDIDFTKRECIVFGKGSKERRVYFDARTKLHLEKYLETRADTNPALFISLNKPCKRLQIAGIEIMVRNVGKSCGISKVHPHKFRRTLATMAIGKGMPVEQVQHLLGHASIETTMQYAMVDENNVKLSHQKFLA